MYCGTEASRGAEEVKGVRLRSTPGRRRTWENHSAQKNDVHHLGSGRQATQSWSARHQCVFEDPWLPSAPPSALIVNADSQLGGFGLKSIRNPSRSWASWSDKPSSLFVPSFLSEKSKGRGVGRGYGGGQCSSPLWPFFHERWHAIETWRKKKNCEKSMMETELGGT